MKYRFERRAVRTLFVLLLVALLLRLYTDPWVDNRTTQLMEWLYRVLH